MTPFGEAVRRLRGQRGVTQKEMAEALGVSPAYLSALEHGHRSMPSWDFLQRVIGYFNIIWDEAEHLQKLAALSHPRITIDTSGLSPRATEVANRMASQIHQLGEDDLSDILDTLSRSNGKDGKPGQR